MRLQITYVYCLLNPITHNVFYVGRTTQINLRLKGHIHESKKKDFKKNIIIREIIEAGLEPEVVILEEIKHRWVMMPKKPPIREKYWIRYFVKSGYDLANIVQNPKTWTKEYRRKLFNTQGNKLKALV